MTPRQKTAVGLLATGVVLGVVADVLFQGRPLGINAAIFAGAFVSALWVLLRVGGIALHQGRRAMAAPLLLFAALLAWHDSPLLVAVNLVGIAGAIALGALRRTAPRVVHAEVSDYLVGAVSAGTAALGGAVAFMENEVPWAELRSRSRGRNAIAVGRGFAIGLPLVLLFGGLFVAADAVFKSLLESAVPNVGSLAIHIGIAVGVGWLSVGLLHDLLAEREDGRLGAAMVEAVGLKRPPVGVTEVVVALGVVDLLFAGFVAVQARYLFGGRGLVESRLHLTYAQYARHGFFELVVVAILVLPLLLGLNMLVRPGERGARLVRGLSAALVGLVLVVMVSALDRMWLYERGYGLTELRIYAIGVILWLAVVFVWLLATVLRGQSRRFATGAVVAGFAATIALNVLDPDALIARTNLARPHIDAGYVGSLSDDAVPTLLARLPSLAPPLRSKLAAALLARSASGGGLLSWNAARAAGASQLATRRAELERFASAR
ncbi:MAG TPA: DUF4153 domain-containing protein [Gaiellaceae bacterium]|nr:DUF4153 domain-containing protein [Gaiellaceae bacterium]